MVVYLDMVFITNFVLDFAMLLATARLRGMRPSLMRIGWAAAIGASYVFVLFAPPLSFFHTFVVKCLFSIGLIMTAFGYGSFPRFIGNLAAFYAVNFAAAGAILGLHYALRESGEALNGILFTRAGGVRHALGVSLWLVLFVGTASIFLIRSVHTGAKRSAAKLALIADVEVVIDGKTVRCKGLIDTGNHLYDPLTRTPVMVMETRPWEDRLPVAWLKAIRDHRPDQIVAALAAPAREAGGDAGTDAGGWRERVRFVPYRGINGHSRLLLAVRPDSVAIVRDGRRIEVTKALIGLEGGELSSDGSYQAIIHPAMVG